MTETDGSLGREARETAMVFAMEASRPPWPPTMRRYDDEAGRQLGANT